MVRLLMPDGLLCVFHQSPEIYLQKKCKNHRVSGTSFIRETQRRLDRLVSGVSWQEGYSNNHSLHLWWAEKHLRILSRTWRGVPVQSDANRTGIWGLSWSTDMNQHINTKQNFRNSISISNSFSLRLWVKTKRSEISVKRLHPLTWTTPVTSSWHSFH